MLIEIYSDVVCPWCYIGETRLEKALAQRPNLSAELRWRPFQLQPGMRSEGQPWGEFAPAKFGGAARAQAAFAQVTEIAAEEGLVYNFDKVFSAPNTVDAHRLILWATEQGRQRDHQWEMAKALFQAYFAEGANLNDREQLVALAARVGLSAETARAFLESDEKTAEVAASQETAERYGISSVPTFVINGQYALVGALPVEQLVQALDTLQKPTIGLITK